MLLRQALRVSLPWLCAGSALAQPAHPPAPQQPLPPLVSAAGDALNPAWRVVGFPKQHADIPATTFRAGTLEGQAAIRVDTDASYGTLVHDWRGPAHTLRWRWRLDQPLTGGTAPPDLMSKAGDDAALKVCVMFDHPLDRVPFMERTALRLARGVSGENLPAATLCYVWDSGRPATLQGTNPYTRRVRFFSLKGSEAPLGQWMAQSRNVAQDFVTLFADELPQGRDTPASAVPEVTSVVIGADSDNTASRSTGWIADLQWVGGAP
ncbi:MAG: DUF3047 domain-containing protein [Hydrogenophaga sp.]|nr:DUF3047 domain-containing protein [Hydrogenophaga sp.]